jgi:hypothetical protein
MSAARRSAIFPLACSGDMYAAVHRITLTPVAPSVSVGELTGSSLDVAGFSIAFASPKSGSLTVRSGVRRTQDLVHGLRRLMGYFADRRQPEIPFALSGKSSLRK